MQQLKNILRPFRPLNGIGYPSSLDASIKFIVKAMYIKVVENKNRGQSMTASVSDDTPYSLHRKCYLCSKLTRGFSDRGTSVTKLIQMKTREPVIPVPKTRKRRKNAWT